MSNSFEAEVILEGEAATAALGEALSLWARPGLLILLSGGLGAGKSALARAFIRTLMGGGGDQDIPSPTFSLVQSYDAARVPVFHADLYRLDARGDQAELGLESLLASHCGLVEWPDRLSHPLGADVLEVTLSGRGGTRTATLRGLGQWARLLERNEVLEKFLAATPFASARRSFFEGDASSRRYEKLDRGDGATALLMDMPQRPDGPPVRNGKPYSSIAHLAEGIAAVVAINTHLVSQGYSAPRILDADIGNGVALIEPLGSQVYGRMMREGQDMREPLEAATAVLADMAARVWPSRPEAAPGLHHQVHPYDREAQLIEVDLLPAWFIPHISKINATPEQHEGFAAIWSSLLPLGDAVNPQWVLRDFHSPNLLWLPERDGLKRVGIIDTQDAVMGHPAYDLVSMAQDARVDIAPELEAYLIAHYCKLRSAHAGFNAADFMAAYAVLGAQRATKILGIFARLNKRDGKPAYLRHIPRVSGYLQRNLSHPALAPLKAWYIRNIPEALDPSRGFAP